MESKRLEPWIHNYRNLFDYCEKHYYYFKYNDFKALYDSLEFYYSKLKHYDEVRNALNNFDDTNKEAIKQWIDDFSVLAGFYTLIFGCNEFSEVNETDKTFKILHSSKKLYLKGEDFFAIYTFNKLYEQYQIYSY